MKMSEREIMEAGVLEQDQEHIMKLSERERETQDILAKSKAKVYRLMNKDNVFADPPDGDLNGRANIYYSDELRVALNQLVNIEQYIEKRKEKKLKLIARFNKNLNRWRQRAKENKNLMNRYL